MVRRICATCAAPGNSIQVGASTTLMVRRTRRPWPVSTAVWDGPSTPSRAAREWARPCGHLLLSGEDDDRQAARSALTDAALTVLAGTDFPVGRPASMPSARQRSGGSRSPCAKQNDS